MKKTVLLLSFFLLGCKGPTGDKGDTGIQGARGPGRIEVLTGSVNSNDFLVVDSRIGQALQMTVYIGDNNALAESPYFIPSLGINTYYLAGQSKVEIFNASAAGATRYAVVLILP